jgi:hypothetical protein
MIKLITDKKYRFGREQVLPNIGTVKIGEDGVIEVESELDAKLIVESNIGFIFVDETRTQVEDLEKKEEDKIKPQTEDLEIGKSTEEEEDKIEPQIEDPEILNISTEEVDIVEGPSIEQNNSNEQEEVELRNQLEPMKVIELQGLLPKDFPKKDYQTLNKSRLIDLIVKLTLSK